MMIINLIGLLLIALIIWWFWLYQPTEAVDASREKITIIVASGVYQPARIKVAANQQIQLHFLRKDDSPCAATVLFPHLDISEELPIAKTKTITLPPMISGEYAFHCPMKMYNGAIIVE